jgi:hypothetical protein
MRSRILPAVGVSALALVAASAFAPTASAGNSHVSPVHTTGASSLVTFHPTSLTSCYKQLDNDNGVGIASQNFEAGMDSYDSRGADDFRLKAACQVKRVDVAGVYSSGVGLARSENVTFYRNNAGLPGGVISNQQSLVGVDDGVGNFKIKLTTAVGLKARTYWVSVQANLDFSAGGLWNWYTNNTKRGNAAAWRQKGDGFGSGCTKWKRLLACIQAGEGPDFAFALSGS